MMEISNRNEKLLIKLVLSKERLVPSLARLVIGVGLCPPLAGHEQWAVTDHGFDLFVRLAGLAMADSLCLRRGKTLGHGIIPISRRLDHF